MAGSLERAGGEKYVLGYIEEMDSVIHRVDYCMRCISNAVVSSIEKSVLDHCSEEYHLSIRVLIFDDTSMYTGESRLSVMCVVGFVSHCAYLQHFFQNSSMKQTFKVLNI
jgi:hypothetical protein